MELQLKAQDELDLLEVCRERARETYGLPMTLVRACTHVHHLYTCVGVLATHSHFPLLAYPGLAWRVCCVGV